MHCSSEINKPMRGVQIETRMREMHQRLLLRRRADLLTSGGQEQGGPMCKILQVLKVLVVQRRIFLTKQCMHEDSGQ